MGESSDYLVAPNCVESRSEVNKEKTGKVGAKVRAHH